MSRMKWLSAAAVLVAAASIGSTAAVASLANNGQWLTTRTAAAEKLPGRFKDIKTVSCAPDTTSSVPARGVRAG